MTSCRPCGFSGAARAKSSRWRGWRQERGAAEIWSSCWSRCGRWRRARLTSGPKPLSGSASTNRAIQPAIVVSSESSRLLRPHGSSAYLKPMGYDLVLMTHRQTAVQYGDKLIWQCTMMALCRRSSDDVGLTTGVAPLPFRQATTTAAARGLWLLIHSNTTLPSHQKFHTTVPTTYSAAVSWKIGLKLPVFSTMKPTPATPKMPAKDPAAASGTLLTLCLNQA